MKTINNGIFSLGSEQGSLNGSFCSLCMLALGLALYTFATSAMSPKKDKTAVHCCDPALSVLAMLLSPNVFHVVSALDSIVCPCSQARF